MFLETESFDVFLLRIRFDDVHFLRYVRVMEEELEKLRVSTEQQDSLLLVELTGGVCRTQDQSCVVS